MLHAIALLLIIPAGRWFLAVAAALVLAAMLAARSCVWGRVALALDDRAAGWERLADAVLSDPVLPVLPVDMRRRRVRRLLERR